MRRYISTFTGFICALIGFSPAAKADWTVTIGNNMPGVLDAPVYNWKSGPIQEIPNALTGNTPSGLPVGNHIFYGSPLADFRVGF